MPSNNNNHHYTNYKEEENEMSTTNSSLAIHPSTVNTLNSHSSSSNFPSGRASTNIPTKTPASIPVLEDSKEPSTTSLHHSQSSPQSKTKIARPNAGTNTYKAKIIVGLSGLIFALAGTCLICAQHAGIADYYFDSSNSTEDFIYNRYQGDNTYTIFMDGLICRNGNCINIYNENKSLSNYSCAHMRQRISRYHLMDLMAGVTQLVFSFMMFAAMFIRFLMHMGKELCGNVAAKNSVFARVESFILSAGKSRNFRRFLFICTGLIMIALLTGCVYLAEESIGIIYDPLCPNISTSFPFNMSLARIIPDDEEDVFTFGRGTRLVLIGSGGALFVGFMYLVWLCVFVTCAMRKGAYDDSEHFGTGEAIGLLDGEGQLRRVDTHGRPPPTIDEILNTEEYENNPEYAEYIAQYKQSQMDAASVKKKREQEEEERKKQQHQNHNNNNKNQQQQQQQVSNASVASSTVSKGGAGLSLLDDGYFGNAANINASVPSSTNTSTKQKRNLYQAAHANPSNNNNNVPVHGVSVLPSSQPSIAATTTTENSDAANKKKKKTTVRTVRRKKKKDGSGVGVGGQQQGEEEDDGEDDDYEGGGENPPELRSTQEPHEV